LLCCLLLGASENSITHGPKSRREKINQAKRQVDQKRHKHQSRYLRKMRRSCRWRCRWWCGWKYEYTLDILMQRLPLQLLKLPSLLATLDKVSNYVARTEKRVESREKENWTLNSVAALRRVDFNLKFKANYQKKKRKKKGKQIRRDCW